MVIMLFECVCVYVRMCAHACAYVCMQVCGRACAHARAHVCMLACKGSSPVFARMAEGV